MDIETVDLQGPEDPALLEEHLASWAAEVERGRWSAWIIDHRLVLRFVSTEHRIFIARSVGRVVSDEELGIGRNIFEALMLDAWQRTVDPGKLAGILPRQFGAWRTELQHDPERLEHLLPEPLVPLATAAPEVMTYGLIGDDFDHTVPGQPPLPAQFLLFRVRSHTGAFRGAVCVNQPSVRPTLVSLLSRGDEAMFERMADLSEPRRSSGAILFADLQGSTRLARLLPTATYFSLIRDLATAIDDAIAAHGGILGKHAGDGASGFFLVSEEMAPATVAAGAIAAARRIQTAAHGILAELADTCDIDGGHHAVNLGIHWAGSMFVGQLVPGGRLEVTALGDPVNECARIQESARDGTILVSKPLIERLDPGDAARLGIGLDRLAYQTLDALVTASDKAKRDAGAIPVTVVAAE